MGKISVDGFERRFALACRPQGTWKDEINRLFAEQQINPRKFCDDTELDETMYYRLKSKDEPPALSPEQISERYPLFANSLFNLIRNTEARMGVSPQGKKDK